MHLRGHGLPLNASDATPAMCDTDRVREKERANCVSMTRVASGATQLVKSDTFCSWSAFHISALSWEGHPRLRPLQSFTDPVRSCASYARYLFSTSHTSCQSGFFRRFATSACHACTDTMQASAADPLPHSSQRSVKQGHTTIPVLTIRTTLT